MINVCKILAPPSPCKNQTGKELLLVDLEIRMERIFTQYCRLDCDGSLDRYWPERATP